MAARHCNGQRCGGGRGRHPALWRDRLRTETNVRPARIPQPRPGKQLLTAAIDLARRLGYAAIKLDTADFMRSAIGLYLAHGFVETPPYRYNPHEEARYFELKLPE
jgi:GNAT superfamily N-acetyltransferase